MAKQNHPKDKNKVNQTKQQPSRSAGRPNEPHQLDRRITFPLKQNMKRPAIEDLHKALGILGYSIDTSEKDKGHFGKSTKAAVADFQSNHGLLKKDDTKKIRTKEGVVDQITAERINTVLQEAGIFDTQQTTDQWLMQIHDALGGQGTLAQQLGKLGQLDSIDTKLGKLPGIDTKLSDHTTKLGSIDGKLGKLPGIDTKLGDHTTKLGSIDGKLGKLPGIDTKLGDHTTKLGSIDGKLGKLLGIDTKLGDHTTKLGSIDGKLGKLDSVDAKLGKLDGIDSKLGKLSKLDIIDTKLGENAVQLTGIGEKLDGHATKLGDISSGIGKLVPSIPLALGDVGVEVQSLQQKLTELGYIIPMDESAPRVFGVRTRESILGLQAKYGLPRTGVFDELTKTALDKAVPPEVEPGQYRVEGRILLENGMPAKKVKLRLYKLLAGKAPEKIDEKETDDQGFYVFSYNPGSTLINLEIRIPIGDKEIPLSRPKFNVNKHEVLNLVAPANITATGPEFDRLMATLGQVDLTEVQENSKHHDLTILCHVTKWDARLITLAAAAAKFKKDTGIELKSKVIYALFRAGLPTDKRQLSLVSESVVEKALHKAKNASIIDLDDDTEITVAKTAFAKFALDTRRSMTAPGTLSSYSDLLAESGLSDRGGEESQLKKFEKLYFAHRGSGEELWEKAKDEGIPANKISALRLQGKLACLTLNNAKLTKKLQDEIVSSLDDMSQLAEKDVNMGDGEKKGLYDPKAWKSLIKDLDRTKWKDFIPPAFPGEEPEDRLNAYASDLARKVRLSFPTQVVRRMIEKDELHLGSQLEGLKGRICTFLQQATKKGFELGRVPVSKRWDDIFKGIVLGSRRILRADDVKNFEALKDGVKRLVRLYQVTPSNNAMQVLLDAGFRSAQDIAIIPYAVFCDRHGDKFFSRQEAELTYRKAQQISAITYGVFGAAKQLDSSPSLYAISGSEKQRQEAKNALKEKLKDYPTMESLFGSLDFCECEHCRSVLSPAAYLVDLLQFIDPSEKDWQNFLSYWQDKHNGESYTGKYKRPFDIFNERRPDLLHLPLTCENTNTALPYIDIVNEILEYYVVNDSLSAEAARDTGDATTPELLAEPLNILPKAYNTLKQQRYPLVLPFDLWLETVRQFCDYFETPFWKVLEVFRQTDDLFTSDADAKPYYYMDIFREYLGISPAEYSLFTQPPQWYELYGFENADEAKNIIAYDNDKQRIDLNSAKAISRRLGVTYKELNDIVNTWFVNPKLEILAILRKLRVVIHDVLFYREYKDLLQQDEITLSSDDRKLFDEVKAFRQRLKELGEAWDASDPAEVAEGWLNSGSGNDALANIIILNPSDTGCNFDETTLKYANGNQADDIAFLKINLFVRLWRKLGWTIEETDRALRTFVPEEFLTKEKIGGALKTAIVYLAHLKKLDEKVKVGKNSRLKLLTLWSNMATTGKNPLYAQLFLTKSVLKTDRVFDDPCGNYLSKANVLVSDHLLALQGVLNLTADEIRHIFEDDGQNPNTAELSLTSVSLLYRYGLIAKAVKLPVRDLIVLKELSGFDPFKLLDVPPTSECEKGHLWGQTLRFVELAEKIRESNFKVEDLDYLLRHQFDPVGKYRNEPVTLQSLVRSLADGLHRIQAEHTIMAYPNIPSEDELRQKLTLILPPSVVETVISMLKGTMEYQAVQADIEPNVQLKPEDFKNESAIDVSYDSVRRQQHLTFRGVLLDVEKARLKAKFPSPVFAELLDDVYKQAKSFFDKYLLDFATADSFDTLFGRDPETNKPMPIELAKLMQVLLSFPAAHSALTEDMLKTVLDKLAETKVLLPDIKDTFFRMWTGEEPYTAVQINVKAEDKLDPAEFANESAIVEVSYDEEKHEQSLNFKGVLVDMEKARLKAKFPSPVFAALLDKIHNQAKAFFDKNLTEFFADGIFNLLFGTPPCQLKRMKLAEAFLPYLQRKLVSQFVVQTLVVSLKADPVLTETLLTDVHLLADPSKPGETLLDGFTAAREQGVRAAFFNGTGTLLLTTDVETADTALKDPATDKYIKPDGTKSASFEGYLEVPAPGAYRFFTAIGKKNAEVMFSLDHLPNPLFQGKAVKDNDEISAFVELNHGTLYRFTFEARKLDGGDVRLLVQGENLPKDRLNQLMLYPATSVERVGRANMLLGKVLQLIQGLDLSEQEVRYLLIHGTDFDDLNLGKLPTGETDASPDKAKKLFSQFVRLVDYARLKRDLASGSDDLVAIFEHSQRTHPVGTNAEKAKADLVDDLCKRLADLTRREEAMETVKDTVNHLGYKADSSTIENALVVEAPDCAQEKGIQRIWEVLQVVEKLGVSVGAITGWATPSPSAATATDLRNAVRARYEPEKRQRVAQSIFDKLRQRKRDALVAHIVHRKGFKRIEQLFEYFLIDPGMEPVVQTSRIQLAISSVQLFIQRCLLNLEAEVHPSTINSKQWQWMKRYRIWEANRKIFLWPENWLEPEFRDDKTYQFQELEGALLQGDVSNDLVEDAFFQYLKKLEELARLDIITMYCEEKSDPESNILHVIGRTFSLPHKYFYRWYAHHTWTPWEPVSVDIEGDHVVAVIWRERLHLFWLTFLEKVQEDSVSKEVTLKIDTKISSDFKKEVEVQLNWAEYFQGEWTMRQSSGFGDTIKVKNLPDFNRHDVFIHVSKEYDEGQEGSVKVHLDSPISKAFRIVSKNSQPIVVDREAIQEPPFSVITPNQPTRYTGSGPLEVNFVERVETEEGKLPETTVRYEESIIEGIQQNNGGYSLLLCTNPSTSLDKIRKKIHDLQENKGGPSNPWLDPASPNYTGDFPSECLDKAAKFSESLPLRFSTTSEILTVDVYDAWREEWNVIKTAIHDYFDIFTHEGQELITLVDSLLEQFIEKSIKHEVPAEVRTEIKRLSSPFFYQDSLHTFFVEASLTETTTIREYNDYVIPVVPTDPTFEKPEYWKHLDMVPYWDIRDMLAEIGHGLDVDLKSWASPGSLLEVNPKTDWVTKPETVLSFGDGWIGGGGGIDLTAEGLEWGMELPGNGGSYGVQGGGYNMIRSGRFGSPALRNMNLRLGRDF